jgi:hypothetical protein
LGVPDRLDAENNELNSPAKARMAKLLADLRGGSQFDTRLTSLTESRTTNPMREQSSRARRFFFVAVALTLIAWLVQIRVNAPLTTGAAPEGIVSFELAGSASRASAILESWGPTQRQVARTGLGLDFLFLMLYPVAISMGCRIGADRIARARPRWASVGRTLSRLVLLCVALDAIENAALLHILATGAVQPWAFVAALMAYPKFGLVLAGLAYAFGTWPLVKAYA